MLQQPAPLLALYLAARKARPIVCLNVQGGGYDFDSYDEAEDDSTAAVPLGAAAQPSMRTPERLPLETTPSTDMGEEDSLNSADEARASSDTYGSRTRPRRSPGAGC